MVTTYMYNALYNAFVLRLNLIQTKLVIAVLAVIFPNFDAVSRLTSTVFWKKKNQIKSE